MGKNNSRWHVSMFRKRREQRKRVHLRFSASHCIIMCVADWWSVDCSLIMEDMHHREEQEFGNGKPVGRVQGLIHIEKSGNTTSCLELWFILRWKPLDLSFPPLVCRWYFWCAWDCVCMRNRTCKFLLLLSSGGFNIVHMSSVWVQVESRLFQISNVKAHYMAAYYSQCIHKHAKDILSWSLTQLAHASGDLQRWSHMRACEGSSPHTISKKCCYLQICCPHHLIILLTNNLAICSWWVQDFFIQCTTKISGCSTDLSLVFSV